jgi:hypothetical protein
VITAAAMRLSCGSSAAVGVGAAVCWDMDDSEVTVELDT